MMRRSRLLLAAVVLFVFVSSYTMFRHNSLADLRAQALSRAEDARRKDAGAPSVPVKAGRAGQRQPARLTSGTVLGVSGGDAAAEKEAAAAPAAASPDAPKPGYKENEDAPTADQVSSYNANKDLPRLMSQSPLVIFSKTYCPHSKDAKHILLDLYDISPPPTVIEIDEHPNGPELQDALATLTGRRTVPNIILVGISIGGADEIRLLHKQDALAKLLTSSAGSTITVTPRKPAQA